MTCITGNDKSFYIIYSICKDITITQGGKESYVSSSFTKSCHFYAYVIFWAWSYTCKKVLHFTTGRDFKVY